MKKIILSTVVSASLMFAASTSNYEISPMFGKAIPHHKIDLEDKNSFGLTLGFNNTDTVFDQHEIALFHSSSVEYDNSTEDTNVDRLLLSGIKDYKLGDSSSLYALVGVGYEKISNTVNNLDSEIVANIGVGAKYNVTDSIALKAEVREVVRDFDNHTTLVHLGLAIPFGSEAKKEAPKKVKTPVAKVVDKVVDGDDDNDGVLNSLDKCLTTMEGVKVDENGCEAIDMNTKLVAHFDFDKSKIRSNDQIAVNQYVAYLKKFPKAKIVIEGHTDSVGSAEYNDKLGIRRALKIRDAVVAQGIDKSRIRVEYYGETMPVIDNKTPEHRAQNRRSVSRIIR